MIAKSIILHTDSRVISFKSETGKQITIPSVTVKEAVFRYGVDGKSAYEIAVEHGFEGTEEEWLDSLHGGGEGGSGGGDCDHSLDTTTLDGKVIVTKDGVSFSIDAEQIVKPAAPTITAGANFYNSKSIEMSAVSGATIRYAMTTDGTTPTAPTKTTGTAYSDAFSIGNTDNYQTTYKIVAVAIKNGMVSDPTTVQTYTCTRRVDAPTIVIGGNKYASSRTVTLTQTAADSIKYRLGDSGEFATYDSSNKPVITTSGQKVYAYSVKADWADSEESVSSAVTLNAKKCYIGQAASVTTEANIKSLANSYERDTMVGWTAQTINFGSTTEYVWFAIPSTAAKNLTIKSNGFGVTLDDAAGTVIGSYRVWRTANKINSSFTFEFI